MAICALSGNIADLGMVPIDKARILFQPISEGVSVSGGSVILPKPLSVTTDAHGDFSVNIVTGVYEVAPISVGASVQPIVVTVPAVASANLAALIGAASPPELSLAEQAAFDSVQASIVSVGAAADALTSEQGAATSAGSAEADRLLAQAARVGAVDAQTGSEAARDDAVDACDQIEGNSVWYLADDADSVTLGVGDQVIVAEASGPYPSVTLAFLT
ncbi:hypothetical protein [Roseicitreum antarcticum]|uniref:Uncharacterized protein n=2 Tax=Roseicitreum antarcticum TaxID=564137 RepID=A0A1H2WD57_9RHOB|nr:hypothetical protein [Roseicitreum antarcticum]SDW78613.1 hypothetical protein SAMN04488238_103347 [Roseicitreum antarcticum]